MSMHRHTEHDIALNKVKVRAWFPRADHCVIEQRERQS
jgi:hypothetical protein